MKKYPAITIRELTDPAIREFSCENITFTNGDGDFFLLPLDQETLKSKGYRNLTDIGRKILNRLNHIVGIKRVHVGEREITVIIANRFHWGYIQSDIIHSFEHAFGRVKVYEEYKLDMQ